MTQTSNRFFARLAREENEALKARIAALEGKADKPATAESTPPA